MARREESVTRTEAFLNHAVAAARPCSQAVEDKRLATLVLLRSETERMTPAAEIRFQALRKEGARVIQMHRQPLAELAAFQVLMTAAMKGVLTRNGKPVDGNE